MGLFKNSCRPEKTALLYVFWSFLYPTPVLPKGPNEIPSTTYPKRLSHQDSHHQCVVPAIDSMDHPPSMNEL